MKNVVHFDDFDSNSLGNVDESFLFPDRKKQFGQFQTYKRPGMLQQMARKAKSFVGMENKKDREDFEKFMSALMNPPYPDFISGIKDITGSDGVTAMVAYTGMGNLLVRCDDKDPIISFKGRDLDLADLEDECKRLVQILKLEAEEHGPYPNLY